MVPNSIPRDGLLTVKPSLQAPDEGGVFRIRVVKSSLNWQIPRKHNFNVWISKSDKIRCCSILDAYFLIKYCQSDRQIWEGGREIKYAQMKWFIGKWILEIKPYLSILCLSIAYYRFQLTKEVIWKIIS